MFISSSNTKKAKQELEKIKLEGVETGKALLKDFLNRELKILSAKRNSPTVINASESDRSNIYKFASLLKDEENMELFKNAIEKQAKSKGTQESGLFNKLIYPIRNNWVNSKSQIKTFLLAHEDRQISADEDKYIGENIEDLDDESRKSLRMKNKNIADKLKSNRLSNVLKVFMALVMWDYIMINEGKQKEGLKNIEQVYGDDKDYFYDEKVSKSGLVGRWRSSFGKHIVETVENSNVKIFPNGKPLPSEVQQAGIGDCYLMAALIALAKTNPKAITDCFVQGLDKIENEDKINIRFFYTGKNITTNPFKSYVLKNVKPVVIVIDKNKVIMPKYIKDGALWPKLIEKAYAIYRKDGYSIEMPFTFRNRLDGGRGESVLFAITGQNKINVLADIVDVLRFGGDKAINPDTIIDTIKRKLDNSRTLVCHFKKRFKTKDVKNNEEIEIYNMHTYAIVGINKEKNYIRLINPWKSAGRKYSTKFIADTNWPEPLKEGGHIAMSFDDFKKNVDDISYTSGNNMYFDKEI